MITIFLYNKIIIKLINLAFILKYKSNPILLNKLQNVKIRVYNHLNQISLIRKKYIIIKIK